MDDDTGAAFQAKQRARVKKAETLDSSHACGHAHVPIEAEEEKDIRRGDFERVIMKLEQKGTKKNILKYR